MANNEVFNKPDLVGTLLIRVITVPLIIWSLRVFGLSVSFDWQHLVAVFIFLEAIRPMRSKTEKKEPEAVDE